MWTLVCRALFVAVAGTAKIVVVTAVVVVEGSVVVGLGSYTSFPEIVAGTVANFANCWTIVGISV